MAKPIVKEDVFKIQELLKEASGYSGEINVRRMGGLTNHSYKVVLEDGSTYAVRIPGEGTADMISRKNEEISNRLACDLGIDTQIVLFKEDGSKVTAFIPDALTMSAETMRRPENIREAAGILRKLHTCKADTGVPFDVFQMAEEYEAIIHKNNVYLFDDYDRVKETVMSIKKEVDALCRPVRVPCHNDPLCENWVRGSDRMYLIDWEYAGMNDGMWDIADVAIEAEYSHAQCEQFLKAYLSVPQLTPEIWKHFTANMVYVDFLWTLWAKTRVPFDRQAMEDWAALRYARLKKNIALYQQ